MKRLTLLISLLALSLSSSGLVAQPSVAQPDVAQPGVAQPGVAQYHLRQPNAIPLHGEWWFLLDPAGLGIANQWYREGVAQENRQDKVTVPHCFSTDPRYEFYTGTAWYRKTFAWKRTTGKRVILHFDAAFYKTNVWLNGQNVGEHEGGYTPFSFDVTDKLKDGDNLLVVAVNNDTWKTNTIPGIKDSGNVNDGFVGWVNYGGIIRPVYLTIETEVYTENVKIETVPDLTKGSAVVKAKVRIRNASSNPASPKLDLTILQDKKPLTLRWKTKAESIPAGQTALIEAEAALTAAQVKLWDLDQPNLYELKTVVGADTLASNFGIREIKVSGAQLLLNGKPVKVGGGNRVIDYPGLGTVEPDWLVEKDFRLMKEAGMEFQRLTHYTPSEYYYDLADRYGMLIITEAGNWQLTPKQMDNDSMRVKFRAQFREMVERDWNHPSVIAYSVGNEYASTVPGGQRWTKDMIAYARELDPTRLYTFASMLLNSLPAKPEDEASQYVDFVSTNTYGGHAKSLDHIHKLYPDKPVFISEWGTRSDGKGGEAGQAQHLSDVMVEIRKRPFVVGASWWTYNDYRSKLFGTNVNGFRPWGIVGPDRSPRLAYPVHQREFSPVLIEKARFTTGDQGMHQLVLKITSRGDFPARTLKGYMLKAGENSFALPDLNPGESKDVTIPVRGFDKQIHITISKPTGFITTQTDIELK
ncbi:beta galactosidase jelly roll domain-containing protein [Dyadobacter sp. CY261]|uniref:glycoside hydrolase family 2 protein n=1 Tax=Dyadobacter sp. CY261 TaxID=2907203 RepID=UPI001F3D7696|nr:glycoside hydrolase family 2 TIM barrel-domain containing protein [Dyadobacter sp. CY261]MCF0070534.1 beta galactosidase jelly roll domain-containing protein [Dyadobacter sp. CY261]